LKIRSDFRIESRTNPPATLHGLSQIKRQKPVAMQYVARPK